MIPNNIVRVFEREKRLRINGPCHVAGALLY